MDYDVVIIGAGAAGLMCALTAGQRGRRVLVIEHANKVGKKILMSGGGRCNFTNIHTTPEHFLSANPHFAKSALARYTPWHFLELILRHDIPYHEKKLGQLFCDHKSRDIVRMLLAECERAGVRVVTQSRVRSVDSGSPHRLETDLGEIACEALVVASGGLSIPRMGASGFGYQLAESLGLPVRPTRAALVPFLLDGAAGLDELSGMGVDAVVSHGDQLFRENILFTHRGLSGPAILQISSYWEPGSAVSIDLLPEADLADELVRARRERPRTALRTLLAERLPRRLVQHWCETGLPDSPLANLSDPEIDAIVAACHHWRVRPSGTEGYRTAEVTLGGVDTRALSSKTMECRDVPGVFFIGEVVDVTGHLGGFNFQWAWASGHAAGEAV